MKSIDEIGHEIGVIFDVIKQMTSELSEEELTQFEEYIETQQSVGFIIDPNAYNKLLNLDAFSKVKDRIKLIRELKKEV